MRLAPVGSPAPAWGLRKSEPIRLRLADPPITVRCVTKSRRGWARGAQWATVQNLHVDHCGADVFVAHQLLSRADVLAAFQEVGGAGEAEGMGRR